LQPSRWDLDEIQVSHSAKEAALRVVEGITQDKQAVAAQWATAVRLAHSNGASLRDIAKVAGTSPQTISKICSS